MFITITNFIIILLDIVVSSTVIGQSKQISINPHVETVIDTFYGILLESEYIFTQNFNYQNPCTSEQKQLELISNIKKNQQKIFQDFSQNFENGYLNTTVIQFSQLSVIGRGILILKDFGLLQFYTIQNEQLYLRSEMQFIELNGLPKVQFYLIQEKILAVSGNDIYMLEPDFSQGNIFINSQLQKILSFSDDESLSKFLTVKSLIFITLGDNQLRIYQLENISIRLLLKITDFNVSIKDMQVVLRNNVYNIIILDQNQIQFYQYFMQQNLFMKNMQMNSISAFGDSIITQGNQLYLISQYQQDPYYIIIIINLNFNDNSFEKISDLQLQGDFEGLLIAEDYFITYGNSICTIIQNLQDKSYKLSQSIFQMPGIKQLVNFQFNYNYNYEYLIGISDNNLFSYKLVREKIYLKCFIPKEYPDQFSFQYFLRTSQLKSYQNFNYTINVNSHQNVEQNINIMLYLMFIFLGLKIFIVIGMIFKYIEYKKHTQIEQRYCFEVKIETLKSTERQQNQALNQESKEVQTTDYEQNKTPEPISRNTLSPNEISN